MGELWYSSLHIDIFSTFVKFPSARTRIVGGSLVWKQCMFFFSFWPHISLTLPRLMLLSSIAQGHKDFFENNPKPCHVGIHLIAPLAESSHLPGLQSFSGFFASFYFGQMSSPGSIRVTPCRECTLLMANLSIHNFSYTECRMFFQCN